MICYQKKSVAFVTFTLMEMMAFGLRPESMEMIQPMGIAAMSGLEISEWLKCEKSERHFSTVVKTVVPSIGIVTAIVLVGLLSQKAIYGSDEWQNALSVNKARTEMFDYCGVPEYSDVKDILDRHGVSENAWKAYGQYLNIGFDYSDGMVEEVAERVIIVNRRDIGVMQTVKWVLFDSYKYYYGGENRAVLCVWLLYIAALIYSAVCKKFTWTNFVPVVAYFISKTAIWGYLYYRGRMPVRVLTPLYIAEILFALTFSVFVVYKCKEKKAALLLIIPTLILCVFSFKITLNHTGYLVGNESECRTLKNATTNVGNYCNDNPNNAYIVSNIVYEGWKKSVLDCKADTNDNYIYAGGWFATSPEYNEYVKKYLSGKDVYFITTIGTDENKEQTELDYWTELCKEVPVMTDSFDSGLGKDYIVYKLAGELFRD